MAKIGAEFGLRWARVRSQDSDAGRLGYGTRLGLSHISGKTFTVAGTPFGIRGVTYGTFLPRADGQPFPSASDVQRDFAAIRERGLNAVRTLGTASPLVLCSPDRGAPIPGPATGRCGCPICSANWLGAGVRSG